MQQSARIMGGFMPGRDLFCDWRELDSKFEAFRLFQYADRELGVPVDRLPLPETVERALKLDSFRAIWILEGIGHIKAMTSSLTVEGMLHEALPECALVPLHAGM